MKTFVHSDGTLILVTVISVLIIALIVGNAYIPILMGGELFSESFKERNLAPQNLSRTLEDAGTCSIPLVPWSAGGAYMSGTLGVSTFAYAPWQSFVTIFMLMRKNAMHALMAGCVSGMAVAFFYQKYRWQTILNVLWNGPDQGSYFHSGGISSMAGTVLLFLLAFSLFGMLEKSGAIRCMMQPLLRWADTEKKGNIAAILFAFVVNVFSASAMCSLVISVSCLMPVYDEKGWKREKMIHSLFLGALYMSLLVPWHSNVVTPMGLLGVAQGGACIFGIVPVLEVVCYLLTFVFSHK